MDLSRVPKAVSAELLVRLEYVQYSTETIKVISCATRTGPSSVKYIRPRAIEPGVLGSRSGETVQFYVKVTSSCEL